MNKVYRRVWSRAKQAMVVTSELAPAQGRQGARPRLRDAAVGAVVLGFGFALAPPLAHAEPVTMERDGDSCTVRVGDGVATAIDCAVLDQVAEAAAAAGDSGGVGRASLDAAEHYLSVNGLGDGSDDALAFGENATAVGPNAIAGGTESAAFGYQSAAEGDYSLAAGSGSMALGTGSLALGTGTTALGDFNSAVGYGAITTGEYASAFGTDAFASDWGFAGGYGAQAGGGGSVAVGASAISNGANGISIGANAENHGFFAIAIGGLALADSPFSTALGGFAWAGGYQSTAIGAGAYAPGWNAIAIGANAMSGDGGTAIGTGAATGMWLFDEKTGTNTFVGSAGTAVGDNSLATGLYGTAIGGFSDGSATSANATGRNSTALGSGTLAGSYWDSTLVGDFTTAIGSESWAIGGQATSLGYNSFAQADNVTVLGANAWSTPEATNGVALGQGSLVERANTVSVGAAQEWTDAGGVVHAAIDRQITNVAAGTEDTDAVNLAQLNEVAGEVGALADSAVFYDDEERSSITLAGQGGTVITNVAAGELSADSSDAVNGAQLFATNQRVSDIEGMIGDIDGVTNAVTYDDDDQGTISLAGEDGTTITNLAAGAVSASSTDAINGAQLFDALESTAAALGGGAGVTAQGLLSAPSFMIQGSSYNNVGAAFGAIDGLLGGINSRLDALEAGTGGGGGGDWPQGTGDGLAVGAGSHAADPNDTAVGNGATATGEGGTAIGQGATATGDGSVALGQGSVADEANTVSVGSADNQRRITNVAAGVNATDAANVGQMQAGDAATLSSANSYTDTVATQTLNSANAYTDSRFAAFDDRFEALGNELGQRLSRQDERIDRMGAMNSAMMNMAINAAGSRSPRGRIAVGAGWQNGESALSVGYGKQLGTRASFSIGGAFSSDDTSAGVGFGIDL